MKRKELRTALLSETTVSQALSLFASAAFICYIFDILLNTTSTGQNVKRKIQDLEQQVANQANLLASRGVALSPTQVESLPIEPGYISQDRPANIFIQGRRSHEVLASNPVKFVDRKQLNIV
jgi:hypothetical protein